MNKKCITQKEAETLKDFTEFCVCTDCECVSERTSRALKDKISSDLNPSLTAVLLKTVIIYMIASTATLAVCPQFGIGPIGGGQGLLGFVEQYGHVVCGAFCGAFFLAGSALLTAFFMSRAQRKMVEKHRLVIFGTVATSFLLTLIFVSNMVNGTNPHLHLEFVFSWLVSGVALSMLAFHVMAGKNLKSLIPS